MEKYIRLKILGEGAHGKVTKYKIQQLQKYHIPDLKSDTVAIKKMKLQKTSTGVSQETYRELLLLKKLSHPGLISIYEVFQKKGSIYIVMEFLQDDLATLSQKTNIFLKRPLYMKEIMKQLLQTLCFMHDRGFLHRDIKPANVLLKDDNVKLIDFGLSKYCHNKLLFSSNVCSIWYRAPELFMGSNNYGAEVDVWSAGLVMAEMMLGQPFLAGTCEIEQLGLIFGVLGTPDVYGWDDVKELKNYCSCKSSPGKDLEQIFLNSSEVQIDFFKKMCNINPKRRITVKEALEHEYFK